MLTRLFSGWEESIVGLGIPALLAIGATIVRTAQHGWQGLARFFGEASLAVLVGICIYWSMTAYEAHPMLINSLCTLSGFFSGVILEAVRKRIIHEILNRGRNGEAMADKEDREERG